ncbi:hypothetical protein L861_09365 [Litchfieldella anticariensis FP35 = DSM 16096]|uniref:Nickel import system ATP-binding protein NikD n=1 Tax=Litchfieldella anticariensis (strain DSM 16096 / CECT 5854 / CIP 108499 / LMG 22089 / FP35) TaxID=1121939 RepID=S2KK73_LITA3|nr:ATP-binding cassette domain-containing protein [Halomonas anticariensis]EPC02542.1 hypothetical protein L861_09365 [Halomonas anticariensis FP35 = DSM 16096]
MKALLAVDALSLSFQRYSGWFRRHAVPCLNDVSLTVVPGEVHAVVGASGAGKSLMAWAVMGLLPANAHLSGTLNFDGLPLDAERLAALRGKCLALIPQSIAALDPLVRSGRQVRWSARRAGIAAHRTPHIARQTLSRYGLATDVEQAYPHTLSGGMARRVLLAMATAGDADLLIADEPTTGLDPCNRQRVLDYLRELADAGKGILLITHDLQHALTVANRVTVFHAGTTLETAPSDAFDGQGERLTMPYTRALWQALPSNGFQAPARERTHEEVLSLA